jgi:hypothetical protein
MRFRVMPVNDNEHQPPSPLEMTIIAILFGIFFIGLIAAVIERL